MINDWFYDFWRVLISPHPNTFKEIAKHANDKFSGGVVWVVLAILASRIIVWINPSAPKHNPNDEAWSAVFLVILFPFMFIFFSYFLNFIYKKLFKRKKECHEEIYYISILIFVPFTLITVLIPLIPLLPTVLLGIIWSVNIYQLILFVIAIQAITNLKYWQALVTLITSLVFTLFAFICFAAWIPSLMNSTSNLMR